MPVLAGRLVSIFADFELFSPFYFASGYNSVTPKKNPPKKSLTKGTFLLEKGRSSTLNSAENNYFGVISKIIARKLLEMIKLEISCFLLFEISSIIIGDISLIH